MEPARLRTYIEGTTLAIALRAVPASSTHGAIPIFREFVPNTSDRQGWQNCPSLLRNETVGMTVASIFLGDVVVVPVRSLVPFRFLAFWQCDLFLRDRFPRHGVEQVGNAVQSSPLFVIGLDYMPGRLRDICSCKHCVSSTRIVV